MTCWSCGLPLPEGARFCARCGVRQRPAGQETSFWVQVLFAFGTLVAAGIAAWAALYLLEPHRGASLAASQGFIAFAWSVVLYGAILAGLQVAALVGLGRSEDWGRVAATLACLMWCLTGFGLLISFPVLYQLWRPQPFRR